MLSVPWDLIVLDYELSGEWLRELESYDKGLTVVKHIVDNKPTHLWTTRFIVRTSDADKGTTMVKVLQKAGYSAE